MWVKTIFVLSLMLTACEERSSELLPKTQAESAEGGVVLSAQVEPLPEPFQYQVRLSWRAPENTEGWVIQRESESQMRFLASLKGEIRDYIDATVSPNTSYTYYLSHLEGESKVLANTSVSIPQDLNLEGEETLEKIEGIRRLFLGQAAVLTAKQGSISIDVDEILSSGGKIQSFAENAEGIPAKSGGIIVIRARKAGGLLYVHARGENGGTGLKGLAGAVGNAGAPGNAARIRFKRPAPPSFKPAFDQAIEELERLHPPTAEAWHDIYTCDSPPTNGANGNEGGTGGSGGTGFPGGNSAKLYVEIRNPTGLALKPLVTSGKGGRGGPGGDGGAGGTGGAAGARDKHEICPQAKEGAQGKTGLIGIEGDPGKPGEIMPYCLKLGDAEFGNCESYATGFSDRVR